MALFDVQLGHGWCVIKHFKLLYASSVLLYQFVNKPMIDFTIAEIDVWFLQASDDSCTAVRNVTQVHCEPFKIARLEESVIHEILLIGGHPTVISLVLF